MVFKATTLLLFALSNATATLMNGSFPRTFAGFRQFTDEPFDYLDVQEGSGSGFSWEHTREHSSPGVKNGYHVTPEVSRLLRSSLMTAFIPSVYVLVFVASVPLNTVALLVFVCRVRPKKPAAIYMLNLAAADLLFGLTLPFKASYHFSGNDWAYGPAMCQLVTAAFYCNMYCSVLLMMCISVDRYLAVVYPIDSLAWRRTHNAIVVCTAMWMLAVAGVMPVLMSEQAVHLPELGITTCHDVLDIRRLRGYYLYYFPILSTIFFFIPLAFSAVCYMRVIEALGVSSGGGLSKKTRAVWLAAAVLTVFLVCFAPTNIILLVHYVQMGRNSHGSYAAYLLSMCIGSISCCLDPFVYYFGSSQCRKQVARVFRCWASPQSEQSAPSGSAEPSRMKTFQRGSPYKKLLV